MYSYLELILHIEAAELIVFTLSVKEYIADCLAVCDGAIGVMFGGSGYPDQIRKCFLMLFVHNIFIYISSASY